MNLRLIVLTCVFSLCMLVTPIPAANLEFQAQKGKSIPVIEHTNDLPQIVNYNIVKTKLFPDMPGYTYTASQAPDELIQTAKRGEKDAPKEDSKVSSVKSTSSALDQPQKQKKNVKKNDKPIEKAGQAKVESAKNKESIIQDANSQTKDKALTSTTPTAAIRQKTQVTATNNIKQTSVNKDKMLFEVVGNPIEIHESLQYLPQIEEYSIVSSIIYPKSRFHIEEAAKSQNFLKKLKDSSKELTDKQKIGKLIPTLLKDTAKFNQIMNKELQKQVQQALSKKNKEKQAAKATETSNVDEKTKLQEQIAKNEQNKVQSIEKAELTKQIVPTSQRKNEIADISEDKSVLKKTKEQEERLRIKQIQEDEENKIKEEQKLKQQKIETQELERIKRQAEYIQKQKQFEKNLEKLKEQQKQLKKTKSELSILKGPEDDAKNIKGEEDLKKIQDQQEKQKEEEARLAKLLREQKEADQQIRKKNREEEPLNNANEKDNERQQKAENEPHEQEESQSDSSESTVTDQLKNAEYYLIQQAKTNNILAELKEKQNQIQQNLDKKREQYERERAEIGNNVLSQQKYEKKASSLQSEQKRPQIEENKAQKLQISKPLIEKFENQDIKIAKPLIDNEQQIKVATPPIDNPLPDQKTKSKPQQKNDIITSKQTQMITFNKKKLYFIISTIFLGICLITIIKRRSLPEAIPKSPDFQGGMLIPSEQFD